MCLNSDTVEALHAITAELKAEHERRVAWLAAQEGLGDCPIADRDGYAMPPDSLHVTRAEAERIFADRIAAHEARLKDLGWTRVVRVEPQPDVAK